MKKQAATSTKKCEKLNRDLTQKNEKLREESSKWKKKLNAHLEAALHQANQPAVTTPAPPALDILAYLSAEREHSHQMLVSSAVQSNVNLATAIQGGK